MPITITTYAWVPHFAQGYVRDLPVRWALAEAGLAYEVDHVDATSRLAASYLARQPFGQVPAYRDDEIDMFESGAIVMHIARRSPALAPTDPAGRARVESWVAAAMNTIDPVIREFEQVNVFHQGEPWTEARMPQVNAALAERLTRLSDRLASNDYLEGRFTAGDLMMVATLRNVVESPAFQKLSTLVDYVARGEARPAFQQALAEQLETFRRNAPAN